MRVHAGQPHLLATVVRNSTLRAASMQAPSPPARLYVRSSSPRNQRFELTKLYESTVLVQPYHVQRVPLNGRQVEEPLWPFMMEPRRLHCITSENAFHAAQGGCLRHVDELTFRNLEAVLLMELLAAVLATVCLPDLRDNSGILNHQ